VPSYAAIKLNKDTIISVLGSVFDMPAGQERLIWAMLKYPYQPGVEHYFVGGNYLRLNQPDYMRQILTRTELDLLFTYKEQEKKNGRPNPNLNWFVVKLRDPHPDLIVELCSTYC
jgi:HKD family nuclease